ncbi:hypothetical protein GCM10023317_94800 [Actinopolymorpha pittospori]
MGLPCSNTIGSPSPTSTYAISQPKISRRCFSYGKTAEIMVASPWLWYDSFSLVAEHDLCPRDRRWTPVITGTFCPDQSRWGADISSNQALRSGKHGAYSPRINSNRVVRPPD